MTSSYSDSVSLVLFFFLGSASSTFCMSLSINLRLGRAKCLLALTTALEALEDFFSFTISLDCVLIAGFISIFSLRQGKF